MTQSKDAQLFEDIYDGKFRLQKMESNAYIPTKATHYASWIFSFYGHRCEFFEKQLIECGSEIGRKGMEKKMQ